MFLFSAASVVVVGAIAAAVVVPNDVQQPLTLDGLQQPQITHHLSCGNETIYNVLSHHKEFSKLTKAIDFADQISSVLNDSSAQITFFAVPNSALRRPRKRHFESADIATLTQAYDLADAVDLIEEFESLATGDDDDDKEKYRKFLKKLVQAILSYHILPHKFDTKHLAGNNTFPTELVLPNALGARPLRIRVVHNLLSPIPTINFYAKVVHPDNKALNGVIHVVNHPLLPPPPVFQELFIAPSIFAIFTSAVQRTGLTDLLDLRYIHGKKGERGKLEGATAVTVFAPTNRAFKELPNKLRLFLFSPFGTRVLRKLLEYHIAPGLVFHTDYVYNKTKQDVHVQPCDHDESNNFVLSEVGPLGYPLKYHGEATLLDYADMRTSGSLHRNLRPVHGVPLPPPASACEELHPHPKPIETHDATLSTALTNHTLHAHIEKFRFSIPLPGHPHNPHQITTKFTINGHKVAVPDIVGLNGAVHVIEHLLDPRGHSHHGHRDGSFCSDGDWEDWEEWLPQWAAGN